MRRRSRLLARVPAPLISAFAIAFPSIAYSTNFANFESHQIHPLELSADGTRLFAVNTPDNRLTVYTVTPQGLQIESEIPVGLEPVAVRQRTPGEVWVVNHLSDDVSIVDLATRNVRATLRVGDEPTDVVFAGDAGRAFVCVSQEDAVKIYDPGDLLAPPVPVAIFGSDPRALATDKNGTKVYVAIFEGGDRTSVLSQTEVDAGGGPPPPSPPKEPSLPDPPHVGLIVKWTGTHWVDETGTKNWETFVPIPYTLPDNDVVELDANAAIPTPRYFTDVGTLNFNLTVNPATGIVYVANTEASNLTRFEPNLRGNFYKNRITLIDPAGMGTVTPVHLNQHINYADSAGTAGERALSLSQPNGAAWDSSGAHLYLAAVGSRKIAVIDQTGLVTARATVGEGPTAVEVDDARDRLYVLNRFTNTVAILDKASLAVAGEVSLGFQPEPPLVTAGRKFLYGAENLSAHGDLACASCHAFANFDNITWDLGNPQGDLAPSPQFGIPPFHPMKGPMATQTLRGLESASPFHWRGDRSDFTRFNPAFMSLMGAPDTLSTPDMQDYSDFIMTVLYPPNPNQRLDRTYPTAPLGQPSAERGRFEFTTNPHDGGLRCQDCHQSAPVNEPFEVSPGTNRVLIPAQALQESQAFKVPHLRNMYEKTGFTDEAGPQKRGFGFVHDGNVDNLLDFLRLPVFQFANDGVRRDVEAFLHAFDTGMAPAVGYQVTVDAVNKSVPLIVARIDTLMDQADAGNIDLVVKGIVGGIPRGYLYGGGGLFESDRRWEGTIAEATLRAGAGTGAELTYTAVPPGSGERIGYDRDEDSFRDREEIDGGSDPADPSSVPAVLVDGGLPPGGARPGDGLRNAPNPVGRAGTEFAFTLTEPTVVSLRIFDVQGREVAVLLDRSRRQGTVTLRWDGRDRHGRDVASGLYVYRLEAGSVVRTRSLVIVR